MAGCGGAKYSMIGILIKQCSLLFVFLANSYIVQVTVNSSGVGENNLKIGS